MNTPVFEAGHVVRTPVNQVLRNTYLLLSMTLVAGAAAAFYAMSSGADPVNRWLALAFMIGMPFVISALRNSVAGIGACFLYTAGLGYIAGPIVALYARFIGPEVPMYAFATTAVIFFGLTGYVMSTRKDFSFLRGMLVAGSMVAVLTIVVFMLFPMPSIVSVILSGFLALLASAGILYSTSNAINGGEDNYIVLAADIYGSIWSLFMNLMHIFGFMSGDD
jgi:modulator of FtsH protease